MPECHLRAEILYSGREIPIKLAKGREKGGKSNMNARVLFQLEFKFRSFSLFRLRKL